MSAETLKALFQKLVDDAEALQKELASAKARIRELEEGGTEVRHKAAMEALQKEYREAMELQKTVFTDQLVSLQKVLGKIRGALEVPIIKNNTLVYPDSE